MFHSTHSVFHSTSLCGLFLPCWRWQGEIEEEQYICSVYCLFDHMKGREMWEEIRWMNAKGQICNLRSELARQSGSCWCQAHVALSSGEKWLLDLDFEDFCAARMTVNPYQTQSGLNIHSETSQPSQNLVSSENAHVLLFIVWHWSQSKIYQLWNDWTPNRREQKMTSGWWRYAVWFSSAGVC